jgi:DNA-binding response OmpR family regulator
VTVKVEGQNSTSSRPAAAPAPTSGEHASELFCMTEVRILVIDDEPAICALVRAALEQPGFSIDTVSNPAAVETTLGGRQYHVIITDYVLPGIQPEQMFEWLRRDQGAASIIVITGYPSMDSVLSSLRNRAYDYVTKPFLPDQIREVVHRCLEARGLLRLSEEALRENLGNYLRDRRKAQGLTLAQLAERTKISLGYLSQIELGKNSASLETLYRICLGLSIKMADLFAAIKS